MTTAPLNQPSIKMHRWLLLAAGWLFVLSGATSLAYEVVWVKILTLQFGSSAWSIATVVAAFMGGLGAGSAWAGRRVDRMRRPLKVYGLLELGIAFFGLISVPLLESMGGVLSFFYGVSHGHFGFFVLARFLLSFAVLFVPTALMGASLPVLVVGLAGEKTFGKRVALLYGINTLGAALGAAFAGLYAIPAFGVSGTIGASVVLGLVVVAGAFLLDRYSSPCEVGPREISPDGQAPADGESPPRLLIAAVTIAGCLGIFYQIAWTRLLIPVVGSSTYAFTIILTTFLVGIGLGSLLAAVPLIQRRPYKTTFAITLALTSFFVLIGLLLVNHLPHMFSAMVQGTGDQTWRLLLSQAALAGSMILLPTCGMGAALPLAIAGWRAQSRTSGRAVGGIYAANTLGSILGSLLAGFVFLPWLGAAGAIRLATVFGLVVATVLLLSDRPARRPASWSLRLGWTGALTVIVAILLSTSPTVDFRNLHRGTFRSVQAAAEIVPETFDLLYARAGRNSTVTVERSPQATSLRVNGKPDASTAGDLRTQYMLGHVPMFLHPEPREVCIIGFGSGSTAYAVTTHPTVSSVDIVEIEAAVIDASKYFASVNHGVVGDPRVRIHLEDGRSFLRYRKQKYDVIISEPSNPWIAGVSSLFSTEFYRLARANLKPGGLICQWIQFYEMSSQTLNVMLNTLAAEFPHVLVFFVKADLVCLASEEPFTGDLARYTERLRVPRVRDSLSRVAIMDSYDLLSTVLRSFPENLDMFRSTIRNTDDNLWLEYRAPIEMYQGADVKLKWLDGERYRANLERLFPGVDPEEVAVRASRSLLRVQPQLANAIDDLAKVFEDNEKLAAELSELAKAAAKRSDDISENKLRMRTVRGLLAEEKYTEIIPIVEHILKSEPRYGLAHRILGWALVRTGEATKGAKHYVKAIEIQPDDYEARSNLASLILTVGAEDEHRHLEKALELNPYFVPAWRIKLRHLLKERDWDEAKTVLRKAERTLSPEQFAELEKAVRPGFPSRR